MTAQIGAERQNSPVKKPVFNNLAILSAKGGNLPAKVFTLLDIMREIRALNLFQWDVLIENEIAATEKLRGKKLSRKYTKMLFDLLTQTIGDRCNVIEWRDAKPI